MQEYHRHRHRVVDHRVDDGLLGAVHRAVQVGPDQEVSREITFDGEAGDPVEDAGSDDGCRLLALRGPLGIAGDQRTKAPPRTPAGVVFTWQVHLSQAQLLLLGRAAPPRRHRFVLMFVACGQRVTVAEHHPVHALSVEDQPRAAGLPGVQVAHPRRAPAQLQLVCLPRTRGRATPRRQVTVRMDVQVAGVKSDQVEQQGLSQIPSLDEDPPEVAGPPAPQRIHLPAPDPRVPHHTGLDARGVVGVGVYQPPRGLPEFQPINAAGPHAEKPGPVGHISHDPVQGARLILGGTQSGGLEERSVRVQQVEALTMSA